MKKKSKVKLLEEYDNKVLARTDTLRSRLLINLADISIYPLSNLSWVNLYEYSELRGDGDVANIIGDSDV